MKKLRLATPGPTEVAPETLLAMAAPVIHHRSEPALEILRRVEAGLRELFHTRQPVHIMAGSGTLGMEAALVNHLSPGEKVVVVEGGKFGERWSEIARAYGLDVHVIEVEWGHALPPQRLAEALALYPDCRAVCATQVETSTATLFDIRALAEVVRKTDALLLVDGISSVGGVEMSMDDWSVDVLVTGSQKAIMLPPGLAFVAASERATARWESARLPRYYTDLRASRKAWEDAGTAFTPAVTLLVGLDHVLATLRGEGIENVWRKCAALGRAARAGILAMGLEMYSKSPAPCVTAALLPANIDGAQLVRQIRERFNMFLAGGQGKLKGRIVRISHMGYVDRFDVLSALSALSAVLSAMGHHPAQPGAGVAAASESLREEVEV